MNLRSRLSEKLKLSTELDRLESHLSTSRIETHRKILNSKRGFLRVIEDLHFEILQSLGARQGELRGSTIMEIGSGSTPLSLTLPHVISSDLTWSSKLDLQLSADYLPVRDGSLDALVGQNVFHHLMHPGGFISDALRSMKQTGSIVLIEPSHSWLARLVFPHLFKSETYVDDETQAVKSIIRVGQRPDHFPNQALSFLVFGRLTSQELLEIYPEITSITLRHLPNGARYLLSGGLNFRQVVPTAILELIRKLERTVIGKKILSTCSLHWMVTIEVDKSRSEITDGQTN